MFRWENGSFYEGKWKDNMRNGYGKMISTSGKIYEGNFVNNKKEGKGK